MAIVKKAIIIGAGPAGLISALRLQKHNNITPSIYEIRSTPTTLGGALGIPSNGTRLLHSLNLMEELATLGSTNSSSLVVHSVKGHTIGEIDMAGWSKGKTGFGYLRIQRVELMGVLMSAVERAGIHIYFGKKLIGIEEDAEGVTARFEDGGWEAAELLIGADGIHSTVRKLHVDPIIAPTYSGISNVFAIVPTKQLPVRARGLRGINATLTTDGLFAITPCTAGQEKMYWFFSREVVIPVDGREGGGNREGWEQRGKKEVEEFKVRMNIFLQEVKGEWGDLLRDVVQQTEVVKFYPIFRLPQDGAWSRGRCLLIGDAAHAMQPHASQGVAMALEDVFLLSRLLFEKEEYALKEIFQVYDERRRPRVNEMTKSAERNGGVRKSKSSWRIALNETVATGALFVYQVFNMDKLGLGQKSLAYDVEEECLDL